MLTEDVDGPGAPILLAIGLGALASVLILLAGLTAVVVLAARWIRS